MSFFGFDQRDLEKDKQAFLDGRRQSEDVAVYTWGEESYDGLGDALQEGGDELNDETFGSVGQVGVDFDFVHPELPGAPNPQQPQSHLQGPSKQAPAPSIWDDKSPFSVLLPRNGSVGRSVGSNASRTLGLDHFSPAQRPAAQRGEGSLPQARTLQEIEQEMLAQAQSQRERAQAAAKEEILHLQRQQEQREQRDAFLRLQREKEQEEHLFAQQLQLQRLREQQLFQQQQQQQLQQLHQRELLGQRTPPPRMMPVSQSPRFLEQRQILLLQQQQEQQQQQRNMRLQELEEALRVEELLRSQRLNDEYTQQQQFGYREDVFSERQLLAERFAQQELEYQQQLQQQRHQRQRSHSPARLSVGYQALQEELASSSLPPQNIQAQQRLLAELTQQEYLREIPPAEQEALRMEAMRKILETEKMEEKRKRKAAKIAHMSRYNDLMTQSDKDFITRIQVSQLVTQDPYADDFYAQVYGAILRSRMGSGGMEERVLKFGSGLGVGLGTVAGQGGKGGKRPSAMQRMEQQVERIVGNARKREEEKGLHSLNSLQGALGKTSGRSYKAAPRQLLQVNAASSPTLAYAQANGEAPAEGAAAQAAKLGREALGKAADNTTDLVTRDPLTQREVLVILEGLYDLVLRVEQLRRDQPRSTHAPEQDPDDPEGPVSPIVDSEAQVAWQAQYKALVDQIWTAMKVMVPVATSDPHPFISLLGVTKGKKILPRLTRHLSSQRMLTLITLLIACFGQLGVVRTSPVLDEPGEDEVIWAQRAEVERQTQAFLGSVMQSILPTIAKGSLRLVVGLVGLFLDRNNVVAVARTRPGLALLTLFLTRVEVIKQTAASIAANPPVPPETLEEELPTMEDAQQWQVMFDHLFEFLAQDLNGLFPSSRIEQQAFAQGQGQAVPYTDDELDVLDQPTWQFLAALALQGTPPQHAVLVKGLREKVLRIVSFVRNTSHLPEEVSKRKLANVDLFLGAMGLGSEMIEM